MKLRYKKLPKKHISNVEIGDIIITPIGRRRVYKCNEYNFSTYYCENGLDIGLVVTDEYTKDDNRGYGNVPYFESSNEMIFKLI